MCVCLQVRTVVVAAGMRIAGNCDAFLLWAQSAGNCPGKGAAPFDVITDVEIDVSSLLFRLGLSFIVASLKLAGVT